MCDKRYQNIPIEKFIYKYDDPEEVMKTLKITDESLGEVIAITAKDEEVNENDIEVQELIEKLRHKDLDIELDLEYLENISETKDEK